MIAIFCILNILIFASYCWPPVWCVGNVETLWFLSTFPYLSCWGVWELTARCLQWTGWVCQSANDGSVWTSSVCRCCQSWCSWQCCWFLQCRRHGDQAVETLPGQPSWNIPTKWSHMYVDIHTDGQNINQLFSQSICSISFALIIWIIHFHYLIV